LEQIGQVSTAQVIRVVDHYPRPGGQVKGLDVLDECAADYPIDSGTEQGCGRQQRRRERERVGGRVVENQVPNAVEATKTPLKVSFDVS
jgi:hypothetical protein